MTRCPFCHGSVQSGVPHVAQECLSHVKQRLRDMTDMRDALQRSLDAEKRKTDKLRVRSHARVNSIEKERDFWIGEATRGRILTRRAIALMRKLHSESGKILEIAK